jgi:hypothetical protein
VLYVVFFFPLSVFTWFGSINPPKFEFGTIRNDKNLYLIYFPKLFKNVAVSLF